jgi:hypothetical protein
MQYSRAQYRKIQLTDAKQVEHLKLENRWARCKYNEHFLMLEGYDVAALKGDSNRFMMDKDYYYYDTTRLFKNRNVEVLVIYTGSRLEHAPMTDYCLFKNAEGYWFAKLGDGDAICFLGTELKMNELEN